MMEAAIVVAGASGNLGTAVCERLARDGARIVALVHRESSRAQLADRLGRTADVRVADLSSEESVEAAFDSAGHIRAAVNCAGGWEGGKKLAETPLSTFDKMIDMNLRSSFLVARAAARRGAKRVVLVSSATAASLTGMSGSAAYNASKAAVIALAKALNEEGVPCSCIAPGTLRTPSNERAMPRSDPSKWVPVDQVAESIAFLCSEKSDGIGGAVITLPSR
jgi:NAD(P)-dependent dehydrogenase (short-subunit alcohol dehydrogenase family)